MALVLCAHGTRSETGRAAVRAVLEAVRARTTDPVVDAYVDVHGPSLDEVLPDLPHPVVVPLLLAPGYHVRVDIGQAVAAHGSAVVGDTLGPSPELVGMLADRLREHGLTRGDAVVLAAAGSSDEGSARSVERCAADLAAALDRPVPVGYGASRSPRVDEVVAAARRNGARRVVVASYLLATGHFHQRLLRSGADEVTAPLVGGDGGGGVDPRLVELVLRRAREARLRPAGASMR